MEHPIYGEVIHRYTRADMLADGSLVDVSELAKEAGFKFPVAMTSEVYNGYVVPAASDAKNWGQDTTGRLWDVFTMLLYNIRAGQGGRQINFSVVFRMKGRNKTVQLKALIGPGDSMKPVLTILLPGQD